MFTHHRLSPTNKLDCPHAMGTNAFSPQRAESFRHLLLLPSPPVAYYRLKPANLRISLGAGAAQFQASPLRVRSHAGACSPPAQRTTTGGCPIQARFWLEWGCPPAQTSTGHAGRCAEVEAPGGASEPAGGWPTLGFDLSCPLPKNGCPTLS